MADTLELIQTLSQEQIEYAKMKYIQSPRKNLDEALKRAAATPQKLVIKNLRQFIPRTDEQKIAEANIYLQKNLFCD